MTNRKGMADSISPRTKRMIMENITGYVSISPWLVGFIILIVGPMVASFYLSFTDYNLLSSPKWIGLDNYIKIFTNDPRFVKSLKVTLLFVFVSVPLKLIFALALAMLFNTGRKGSSLFTTIYYIPSIIGGSVAIAVVWKQLFGRTGVINELLQSIGISGTNWIGNPDTALSVLILLVIWQFGSPMIIFLAGLRQVPQELYEAASVDGDKSSNKLLLLYSFK